MVTKRKPNSTRKTALTPVQIETLRKGMLAVIKVAPHTCLELASLYGRSEKMLINHLRAMRDLGLVHCTRSGKSSSLPFIWNYGPGESVIKKQPLRKLDDNFADADSMQSQRRVTTWPAVTIPKQNPWSALGL